MLVLRERGEYGYPAFFRLFWTKSDRCTIIVTDDTHSQRYTLARQGNGRRIA